jgi:hypothetical protein
MVSLLVVPSYLLIEAFVRPHRGKSRKIHSGQKIHSSLVRAAGSTADNYTPKARSSFDDNHSFWERLRAEDKGLTDEWLEVDLSEHIKQAVEELVTNGDDTALKSLYHTSISSKLSHPGCFSFS